MYVVPAKTPVLLYVCADAPYFTGNTASAPYHLSEDSVVFKPFTPDFFGTPELAEMMKFTRQSPTEVSLLINSLRWFAEQNFYCFRHPHQFMLVIVQAPHVVDTQAAATTIVPALRKP